MTIMSRWGSVRAGGLTGLAVKHVPCKLEDLNSVLRIKKKKILETVLHTCDLSARDVETVLGLTDQPAPGTWEIPGAHCPASPVSLVGFRPVRALFMEEVDGFPRMTLKFVL